jgi:hypothetical protein
MTSPRKKLTIAALEECVKHALENETEIPMVQREVLFLICQYLNDPDPDRTGKGISPVMQAGRILHEKIEQYFKDPLRLDDYIEPLMDILYRLENFGVNAWPQPLEPKRGSGRPKQTEKDAVFIGNQIANFLAAAGYRGNRSLKSDNSATAVIGAAIIGLAEGRPEGDFTSDAFAQRIRNHYRESRGRPKPPLTFEERFPETARIKIFPA